MIAQNVYTCPASEYWGQSLVYQLRWAPQEILLQIRRELYMFVGVAPLVDIL